MRWPLDPYAMAVIFGENSVGPVVTEHGCRQGEPLVFP